MGAFLGTALLLSANSNTVLQGVSYLVVYSFGLAIPFLMSALLINELQGTFAFIKKHYKIINMISGYFLIIVGLLMMFGYFERVIMFLAR